jgi:alpha-tubulin suppressor-like RCC1 family protein
MNLRNRMETVAIEKNENEADPIRTGSIRTDSIRTNPINGGATETAARGIAWGALSALLLIVISGLSGIPHARAATLAAGDEQTCAINQADNRVYCWGYGSAGQLGNGLEVNHAAPTPTNGLVANVRAVVSGGAHSCDLDAAGAVRCWGYNASGQLGDGTNLFRATPTPVIGLDGGVTALALGQFHSCAVLQSGSVKCWGESDNGRLGSGHTSDQTAPVDVLTVSGASAIDAGVAHTCAIAGSTVRCWGYNSSGQLGDGSSTTRPQAVDVSSLGFAPAALVLGGYHSCARSAAGALRCWGYNNSGQLGDGTQSSRNLPVNVDGLASGVSLITAGTYHTCALTAGAQLKCWGFNGSSQLGNGTQSSATRPSNVLNAGSPIVELSAGEAHTCVRGSGNAIRCWGNAHGGRTAVGNTESSDLAAWSQPQPISGLSTPLRVLALFDQTSCAVTVEGAAMCWGENYYGQIGDGAQFSGGSGIDHSAPRDVDGLSTGVRDITAGQEHACAVKSDGSVWCWGYNNYFQLGDGTTITRIRPVQVTGISNAVAVDSGEQHSCALTASGAVFCWGRNQYGQLGDGSLINRDHPVAAVGLDQGVVGLSIGALHSCAVLQGGGARCWGRNDDGELGDGTTVDRYLPTALNDSGTAYAAISAGGSHTCGRTAGGQAKCWGYNGSGQIGNGTTSNRTSPTAVDGLGSGVTDIAAGSNHSCALRGSAEMKCWGYNGYYHLGDGTTTTRTLPVNVINAGDNQAGLALGTNSTCVRTTDGRGRCWGRDHQGQLGNGSVNYNWTTPREIAQWRRSDKIFADTFQWLHEPLARGWFARPDGGTAGVAAPVESRHRLPHLCLTRRDGPSLFAGTQKEHSKRRSAWEKSRQHDTTGLLTQ